jgi:hypothetical protein
MTPEEKQEKKRIKEEALQKFDILGQPIVLGCYVAAPRSNALKVCQVEKITNKMVHLKAVNKTGWRDEFMIYPEHAVRLDGPDALAYILKAQ